VLPFGLAVIWSLVDPATGWEYPDVLPPSLTIARWSEVWTTTALPQALRNSYLLAPCAAVITLILAMPTAYCFARYDFPGKGIAQVLTLLPLVVPGFVLAIFFSSLIFNLGIYSRFLSILIAHCVLFLPYAIRIMTVSFEMVNQDLIDAARDLGASPRSSGSAWRSSRPCARHPRLADHRLHPVDRGIRHRLHRRRAELRDDPVDPLFLPRVQLRPPQCGGRLPRARGAECPFASGAGAASEIRQSRPGRSEGLTPQTTAHPTGDD
jgi:hypothetical protein